MKVGDPESRGARGAAGGLPHSEAARLIRPSSSSTEDAVKISSGTVLVDYKANDYRGFLFVQHESHGFMLLKCTRKKNKPPHWQLPGGHIDEIEFLKAAKVRKTSDEQLLLAAKAGAARELFEETGMDLRSHLNRLEPAEVATSSTKKNLKNEFKHRLFFFVRVTDEDFPTLGESPMGTEGRHLKLKLSIEHSGFIFQPDPSSAANMIKLHSGGKCSEALLRATGYKAKSISSSEKVADVSVDVQHRDANSWTGSSSNEDLDVIPKPEKKCMICCWLR